MRSKAQRLLNWHLVTLGMGGFFILLTCCVGGPLYFICDWVPESTRAMLPGATAADVRLLLGEPDRVDTALHGERWYYRRPLRMAEFRVDFDRDGRAIDEGSYDR